MEATIWDHLYQETACKEVSYTESVLYCIAAAWGESVLAGAGVVQAWQAAHVPNWIPSALRPHQKHVCCDQRHNTSHLHRPPRPAAVLPSGNRLPLTWLHPLRKTIFMFHNDGLSQRCPPNYSSFFTVIKGQTVLSVRQFAVAFGT